MFWQFESRDVEWNIHDTTSVFYGFHIYITVSPEHQVYENWQGPTPAGPPFGLVKDIFPGPYLYLLGYILRGKWAHQNRIDKLSWPITWSIQAIAVCPKSSQAASCAQNLSWCKLQVMGARSYPTFRETTHHIDIYLTIVSYFIEYELVLGKLLAISRLGPLQ